MKLQRRERVQPHPISLYTSSPSGNLQYRSQIAIKLIIKRERYIKILTCQITCYHFIWSPHAMGNGYHVAGGGAGGCEDFWDVAVLRQKVRS